MERDLLGLGEEVRRVAVERQRADDADRAQLLGHDLGRVEQVDALEGLVLGVGHDLHAELPLREVARSRCVRGGRGGGSRDRCRRASGTPPTPGCGSPATGFQWNFTSDVEPSACDEAEGVDAEALHRGVRAGDRPVRHRPTSACGSTRAAGDTKSQNVSCADWAWGISRSGSGFTAWMRSGNLMPSWMKKTGMLLPTRSKLPSSV